MSAESVRINRCHDCQMRIKGNKFVCTACAKIRKRLRDNYYDKAKRA